MNLKDFLKLAGEQGKVVVVGDDGNVKGVFLHYDEYHKLASGKPVVSQREDIVEKANREILQAQLEEVIAVVDGGTGVGTKASELEDEPIDVNPPERIDSLLSKRAQDLFRSIPYDSSLSPHRDFKTPEVATSSDEEIKPNFDDI